MLLLLLVSCRKWMFFVVVDVILNVQLLLYTSIIAARTRSTRSQVYCHIIVSQKRLLLQQHTRSGAKRSFLRSFLLHVCDVPARTVLHCNFACMHASYGTVTSQVTKKNFSIHSCPFILLLIRFDSFDCRLRLFIHSCACLIGPSSPLPNSFCRCVCPSFNSLY